jgi:sugar phosphate isomerase/epimerase
VPEVLIGCSTSCFTELTLEEALNQCHNLAAVTDLDALEVGMYPDMTFAGYPSTPWPWEDHRFWGVVAEIVSQYKITGAHFAFLDLNIIAGNPRIRSASLDLLRSSLKRSSEVGFDYGVAHLKGERYGLSRGDQRDLFIDCLLDLEEYSRQLGVVLCLENARLNAPAIVRLDHLVEVLRAVDSPFLRLLLDVGHANLNWVDEAGNSHSSYGCYQSLENVLSDAAHLIYASHVHNNDGFSDRHWPLTEGEVDFRVLRSLVDAGFEGPLILEADYGLDLAKASNDGRWLTELLSSSESA